MKVKGSVLLGLFRKREQPWQVRMILRFFSTRKSKLMICVIKILNNIQITIVNDMYVPKKEWLRFEVIFGETSLAPYYNKPNTDKGFTLFANCKISLARSYI